MPDRFRELQSTGLQHAEESGWAPGYVAAGLDRAPWQAELCVQNALDRRPDGLRDALCIQGTCLQRLALPIAPRLVGLTVGQRF